jgi:hypothetical protein
MHRFLEELSKGGVGLSPAARVVPREKVVVALGEIKPLFTLFQTWEWKIRGQALIKQVLGPWNRQRGMTEGRCRVGKEGYERYTG